MYICDICNKEFSTKSNLKKHKETAKYCIKLQNNKVICKYCKIEYDFDTYNLHLLNCLEINYNNIIIIKSKLEDKNLELIKQNEELKQKNNELESKLNDITLKLIEKSNNITNHYNNSKNNTTNNTKIDIFNSLSPLTEDDYKKHINKLSMEHIRKGAEGYADYALNYTLKDKLMCLDYSRKKICYKNEQGDKVEEYRLNNILPKIFKEIEPVNKEMILALMNNLNDDFLEYEKTITEFDEGDETDKEYSKKIEENQEQIMKYSEILGECYSISNGITNNKLGTEITDIVINKIPKK
jgi:hypothetical protein